MFLQCDLARPQCGQCTKGRRRCIEPDVSFIFSNWTVNMHRAQLKHPVHGTILQRPFGSVEVHSEPPDLTQLWERFLRIQLPSASSSVREDNTWRTTSLWQSLTQLDRSSTSLRYALAAIASARLGRIESNCNLYKSAVRLYTSAVSSLRGRLSDKTERTSIDDIATIMTLAAYEVRTLYPLSHKTDKRNSFMRTRHRGSVISVTPRE